MQSRFQHVERPHGQHSKEISTVSLTLTCVPYSGRGEYRHWKGVETVCLVIKSKWCVAFQEPSHCNSVSMSRRQQSLPSRGVSVPSGEGRRFVDVPRPRIHSPALSPNGGPVHSTFQRPAMSDKTIVCVNHWCYFPSV